MFLKEEEKSELTKMARIVTKKQEEQPIHLRQEDERARYHADYIVLDPAIRRDMSFEEYYDMKLRNEDRRRRCKEQEPKASFLKEGEPKMMVPKTVKGITKTKLQKDVKKEAVIVDQEEKLKLLDIIEQVQEEPYKQVEVEDSLLISNDCVYQQKTNEVKVGKTPFVGHEEFELKADV